jgi:hypothetical protein
LFYAAPIILKAGGHGLQRLPLCVVPFLGMKALIAIKFKVDN